MGSMKTTSCIALVGLSLLMAGWSSTALGDALEVGDLAPGFSLAGSDGNTYSLAQFAGKQGVVLAWFPKAFTAG